jgi:hypothetical protein
VAPASSSGTPATGRRPEEGTEHAFEQQGDAERQQQPVQVVQLVQPAQHGLFDDDAEQADQQRGDNQHRPIIESERRHADEGDEGAHHVQRAVREVDHIEQAEDDGEAKREHGIEGAVDQAQQELAHHGLERNAENFHGITVQKRGQDAGED